MMNPCRLIVRIIVWAVLFVTASETFTFAIQPKQGACDARAVSFRYRAAQERDLRAIYDLLHESFDGSETSLLTVTSTPWSRGRHWSSQLPAQLQAPPLQSKVLPVEHSEKYKYQQLERRWTDLVQNSKIPHTWIVAETKLDSQIAGFMELGSMPSPIAVPSSLAMSKTNETGTARARSGFNSDKLDQSIVGAYRPDRPFLANLAVSKQYRRQGIAKTLVKLALKISKKKWSSEGEEEKEKGGSSPNAAALSWWMYLSVDKDNEAATRLYDSLDFSMVLDETQVLSPERLEQLSRPPRRYYGKRL